MKTIRFSGLVRLANGIQRELCNGVPPSRCDELRIQVQRAVTLVDRTLMAHGASLRAIPGPTRRAYEFLRTIDFDKIEQREESDGRPEYRQVSLRGLVARVEQIADRLADVARLPESDCHLALAGIARWIGRIDSGADQTGVTSDELTLRSREHLAWIRYFNRDSSLQSYLAAIQRGTAVLESVADSGRWPRPIVIHFRPTHSVFRARAEPSRTRVLLPTPMITLDAGQWNLMAHAVFGRRSRRHNAALHNILIGTNYQNLRLELEQLGGVLEETRGMAHDLAESFDRVNARYFANQMSRPRLTWNRSITAGKFGHYHYATDTVMVSRSLDRPQVPAFVVDHVMHHELLHKKHGLRWQDGRGHAHTSEFRREEMAFEKYCEADQYLQKLATMLVSPSRSA